MIKLIVYLILFLVSSITAGQEVYPENKKQLEFQLACLDIDDNATNVDTDDVDEIIVSGSSLTSFDSLKILYLAFVRPSSSTIPNSASIRAPPAFLI